MLLRFLTLAFLFVLLSAEGAPLHSLHSPEKYRAGDEAFRERRNGQRARQALDLYRGYLKASPKDAEAAWRVSMACHFVGMRLGKSKEEKEELYTEGKETGRLSIELLPECAACHFWTAINIALYGQEAGIFKMFFTLGIIQQHLKETVRLDPTYAYGGAYRLLGLIQQKLPGILGGSNSEARVYFEKAIAAAPDEPLNYINLSRLLYDELKEKNEALAVAKRGAALPPPPNDRVESQDALQELKAYLLELEAAPLAVVTP